MWTDLERPPLRAESLRRGLVAPHGPYAELDVVAETGSTNHDLRLAVNAPDRAVLVAEHQTGGRGRAGRQWSAPPRSGLFLSVLLRPAVPPTRLGWLPLVTGLAVATAVRRIAEVDVRLKWPNDLLVGERKLAGILAEVHDGAVIVGIGLNVTLREAERPVPAATSLALEGAAVTDRDPLLRAVLRELAAVDDEWRSAGGDSAPLRDRYRELCVTIGQRVRVELPAGEPLSGTATGVDDTGRLVVRTGPREQAVSAGDVVHVRPA